MNTWHKNNSRQGLNEISEITKSLESATLSNLVCMLVLVTTKITKIHGINLWKDSMAYFKTHVGLNFIGCTHHGKNDKSASSATNLKLTSHSPLLTAFRASR